MAADSSGNIVTIATSIVTVVGTIAGVIIANTLTSSQSYKKKIWDLRRVAYGVILSELAAAERIYDSADEYLAENNFHQYFERKLYERDRQDVNKHLHLVYQRTSDDYLILSSEFIALYNRLTEAAQGDPYNDGPPETYEAASKAIRKYRPLLANLARNEIASHGQ